MTKFEASSLRPLKTPKKSHQRPEHSAHSRRRSRKEKKINHYKYSPSDSSTLPTSTSDNESFSLKPVYK